MSRKKNATADLKLFASLLGAAAFVAVLLAKSIGKNSSHAEAPKPNVDHDTANRNPSRPVRSAKSRATPSDQKAPVAPPQATPAAVPAGF